MILVVEDDPDLRDVVAELLRCEGYEVACANNGADALARLEGGLQPDFILVDLGMPRMSGVAFRAAQRQNPRFADIPLAFMSGQSMAQETLAALRPEDRAPVLKKPIGLETLFSAIAEGTCASGTRQSVVPAVCAGSGG